MMMQRGHVESFGILKAEYMKSMEWKHIPESAPIRRSLSVSSKSSNVSMSSSSSRTSSQESLSIYGTSPEAITYPRMIGLKPQDRLRRIRESYKPELFTEMEIDKPVKSQPEIYSINKPEERPTMSAPSSMMIDDKENSDTQSVYSVSMRLKRFREARDKLIRIQQDNKNNNIYNLPSLNPWEHEKTPLKKLRRPHSVDNNFSRRIPPVKPLRRPHIYLR